MADTTETSIQVDAVNNLYKQIISNDQFPQDKPPDGVYVPSHGTWAIGVDSDRKMEFIDNDPFVQGITPPGSSRGRLYGMFEITLPAQGIVKLLQSVVNLRVQMEDGVGVELGLYIFNNSTNVWEEFITQFAATEDEWFLRADIVDFSSEDDISEYVASGKMYFMIYTNKSTTAIDEKIEWEIDYFRLDLLYCNPYYTSVEQVRSVSNLKLEEISSAQICKFITKAQTMDVDPKMKGMFTVPFVDGSVPNVIQEITAELAASYSLRKTHVGTSPNVSSYGEELRTRAMDKLTAICNGTLDVDTVGNLSNMQTTTPNPGTVFTLGPYPDVSVDPPIIDDDEVEGA